jgi:hypothetical protein
MPAPLRAAWHRDAAHALAESDAPPDRVARQMLGATGGPAEPMDERMLKWLAGAAEPLVRPWSASLRGLTALSQKFAQYCDCCKAIWRGGRW